MIQNCSELPSISLGMRAFHVFAAIAAAARLLIGASAANATAASLRGHHRGHHRAIVAKATASRASVPAPRASVELATRLRSHHRGHHRGHRGAIAAKATASPVSVPTPKAYLEMATSLRSHHRSHHRGHRGAIVSNTTGTRVSSPPLSLARRAAARWRSHAARRQRRAHAAAVAGVASNRPIITGCLKECEYEDQTCVTQCQVCVEHNECRILGKCDGCLQEARQTRLLAAKVDKTVLDAGGVAMKRDGLMAELTRARLEALDRKRKLRLAREEVLKAQRQAEWAAEERHMSAQKLLEARQDLKSARLEVVRWKLRNEKKLKAMRAKAQEQRVERQKAQRKLVAARSQVKKARRRLRIAANASEHAGNGTADEEEDEQDVWEAARDLERRQQAVERAEDEVEKASADGEWLDRGLQRRVKRAQSGARRAREELLEGRARERVSRQNLDDTKDEYVEAVAASQRADKASEVAERNLRKAPSSYKETAGGKDGKAQKGIERALATQPPPPRSASANLAGSAWLVLLAFFVI